MTVALSIPLSIPLGHTEIGGFLNGTCKIGMALGKKWFALNESIGTISVHEI